MSGGRFEYKQYEIGYIADSIDRALSRQGREKPESEHYWGGEYFESYPQEVQDRFKEAIKALRVAQIYAHRIDYLLSGDDGEESFLERLKEELIKYENGI